MAYPLNILQDLKLPMDIDPFFIEFFYNEDQVLAEIKPCCKENDIFYYDVLIKNEYQFTITPGTGNDEEGWKITLKNADKKVDPQMVQLIGEQVNRYHIT